MEQQPVIALIQPADQPPDRMLGAARAAEEAGLEELWLWEDCFAASGIAPAAAILAATSAMRVGIGLMPTPLRAPSLTAMEIATLAAMFPGRFLPGLGHGVQDWMTQIGGAVASPVTLLREQLCAIGPLLRGEEVTTSGRYVTLDRVQLRFPPAVVPPLLVGGRGPRTLALAGALADGVILDDAAPRGRTDPSRVAEAVGTVVAARAEAGREGSPEVVAFLPTADDVSPAQLAEQILVLGTSGVHRVAAFAGGVDSAPASGDRVVAFVDVLAEARDLVRRG
ncbi:LLM class flavin-dependent oxidoreductase [Ornithinimicrobium cavernae]|uniref:LLM class flavin-dependent oxidoreductase n=1 Tax=Ornithinimicrobium cavernae TaxID=2666047 RepID=UPI000D685455|nr:LLM class flavin-dependent oxidoreductase [Ornithinimicrobium cavernae]